MSTQQFEEMLKFAHRPNLNLLREPRGRRWQAVNQIYDALRISELALRWSASVTPNGNQHPNPEVNVILQGMRQEAMELHKFGRKAILEIILRQPLLYTSRLIETYDELSLSVSQLCIATDPARLDELERVI